MQYQYQYLYQTLIYRHILYTDIWIRHTIYRYLDTIFHTVSKHTAYTTSIPISISDTDIPIHIIYRYLDTILHTVSNILYTNIYRYLIYQRILYTDIWVRYPILYPTYCIQIFESNIQHIVFKHYRPQILKHDTLYSNIWTQKPHILYPNILHTHI